MIYSYMVGSQWNWDLNFSSLLLEFIFFCMVLFSYFIVVLFGQEVVQRYLDVFYSIFLESIE